MMMVMSAHGARLRADVPPPARPYAPMTTHDLARMIQRYLPSEDNALLCCAEFLDEYRDAPDEVHDQLLAPEPMTTGDQRWDALIAALAEHLAFHEQREIPAWVGAPSRFLSTWWVPYSLPSVRIGALAESPAAFRRRGCSSPRTSSAVPELLDEATLLQALRLVGEKLARQGKRAEIYIFGGSCMVRAFKSRPAIRETADLLAAYLPREDRDQYEAAVRIANAALAESEFSSEPYAEDSNPDDLWERRLRVQSLILRQVSSDGRLLRSIAEDIDNDAALLYFSLDHKLLATNGTRRSAVERGRRRWRR
jgi:hypothetical protein